ncbi:MAG: sugar ABC transporter ATP-binding protein, partial [Chloroflexi bacterium]|nr:sugar ABC transporter ATP-binding protein [Chloroflexota bacterium]
MTTAERSVAEQATESRTPLLELRHISRRFGAVQALTDVDFEVYVG